MNETTELSRAGWVRQQLFAKPDMTFEELLAAFDKSGRPKSERPKEPQIIYAARSGLAQRWGWKSLAEIPRTTDGTTISMAGMVRRYMDMFRGDATFEHAAKYFAADGLVLKPATWHNAKSEYLRKAKAQPDANQDAGPRAGKPEEVVEEEKPRRKRRGKAKAKATNGRRRQSVDVESPLGRYQEIERTLDEIIGQAESLKNWQLAEELRNARRRAGAGVLQYST